MSLRSVSKYTLAAVILSLLLALPTNAANLKLPNPLEGTTSIPQLIARIFNNIVLYVAPPLAAVMIIIGAFLMITAGGDPEKFAKGKKTVLYTAIGLIVVILGSLIAQLIAEILGAPPEVIDAFGSLGS